MTKKTLCLAGMVLATALVSGCVCSYSSRPYAGDPAEKRFRKSYNTHREFMQSQNFYYEDAQGKRHKVGED